MQALQVTEGGPPEIHFWAPSEHVQWRVKTLLTKEPITIEWLNGLTEDDVLWDVGANMGGYALWAALRRGCKVHAFEPESQNFALLNINIMQNHVNNLVTAWPFCLGRELRIDTLNLTQFLAGGSCHQFGDTQSFSGKDFVPEYRQGSVQVSGLAFGTHHGFPTAVKIDVDGHEPQVVEGIFLALYDKLDRIRTLIVEVNWNRDDHLRMVEKLNKLGFTCDAAQIEAAKRKDGPFENVGETVFAR